MAEIAQTCPCGSGQKYLDHCGLIHRNGDGLGATAESLMRARYSAYVLQLGDFLLQTWHAHTRPESLDFDPELEWLGLEIVDTYEGGAFDNSGVVEFRARFRRGTENLELHERSSFARVDGNWVYAF